MLVCHAFPSFCPDNNKLLFFTGKKDPGEVQSNMDVPSSGQVGVKHSRAFDARLRFVFASLKTGIKRDTKLLPKKTIKLVFFVKNLDKNVVSCDIIVISAPVRSSS